MREPYVVKFKGFVDQYGNLLDKFIDDKWISPDGSEFSREGKLPSTFAIPFDAENIAERNPITIYITIDKGD